MGVTDISLIISTYNQPKWLEKVLWSYNYQTFKNFEVIIADDGSNEATKQLIESMRMKLNFTINHVWHEDNGFQKTIILNKAILASRGKYLVFTDGDCIARKDFLSVHASQRAIGYFLSGGYFKLPMDISKLITHKDIASQDCFNIKWLKDNGLSRSIKNTKITSTGLKRYILNTFTPTTKSWNGHNASGYKDDIVNTNGFDERMQYGGEDRELGERLINAGIKPKQIRYLAICLHLDHKRSYVRQEMLEINKAIRQQTKLNKFVKTIHGIKKN